MSVLMTTEALFVGEIHCLRLAMSGAMSATATKAMTTTSSNKILAPKTHQLGGFEGGDKPLLAVDAQLGDLNQTATKNALEKAQNTQQSTKVWLK